MTQIDLGEELLREAERHRGELFAHCYRMMGSAHEAEELVQETLTRAWRFRETYEGRASLRTWLYRIATRACLTALEGRGRRPLPSALGAPGAPELPAVPAPPEIEWLSPVPTDPAADVAARYGVRLAFIAALQHLSARQRAVLILRDVLGWRAAEVAEALDITTVAVNGVLQRARARMGGVAAVQDEMTEPPEAERRALLDRWVKAFEERDFATLAGLLADDAILEMPPILTWFRGAADIAGNMSAFCSARPGDVAMVPTVANGQPAYGVYQRGDPVAVQVLTLEGGRVTHVYSFGDLTLIPRFGLPPTVPWSPSP